MKTFLLSLLLCLSSCLWAQSPQRIACVGNSITYGTALAHRSTAAYPVRLQQLLGNAYDVQNFGRPSATLLFKGYLPYVEQPEFHQALAFCPDIVVIHLGINDTDPRAWPCHRDDFVSDYTALIDSFRQVNPQVRVLIAQLTPLSVRHHRFESGTRDWHRQIQRAIQRVARHNQVELFSLFTPFYHRPDLFPDGIHPNAEGAQIMAQTVYSAITGNYGGLQVSPIYTDSMVIQRLQPIHLEGIANKGERVTAKLNHHSATTRAGKDGKWQLTLPPLPTGGDYTLSLRAPSRSLSFHHVTGGDVWLCAGQSNMEFMLQQSQPREWQNLSLSDADLRLFDMKARYKTLAAPWGSDTLQAVNRLDYYKPTVWRSSTPATARRFSAVAYHFGKMLRDSTHVPIGLICNAVGGSTTSSWIDRATLEQHFPKIFLHWANNDFIQPWVRQRAQENTARSNSPLQRHPYHPAYLFESGIAPLQHFPIKGVIWYQGESNAHNVEAHHRLFRLLVKSWRNYFGQSQLPFYFVQLSSLNRPTWHWFRYDQWLLAQHLPHTAMAVSSDKGHPSNVHPTQKADVGHRLARWALLRDYHHSLTASGPVISHVVRHKHQLMVYYRHAEGLRTADAAPLRGFELSADGDFFYPATAHIEGQKVVLSSPQVDRPLYMRYAWSPFTDANLVNGELLPASTDRARVSL